MNKQFEDRACSTARFVSETGSKISLKFGFEVYSESCLSD
jgi:hypothetical protein